MKFSHFAVTAFVAAMANAEAQAEPQVTVYYNPPAVTNVKNVYVTVTAGSEPDQGSSAPDDGVATAVVYRTAYVDQYGNLLNVASDSAQSSAAAAPTNTAASSHSHASASTVVYSTSFITTSTSAPTTLQVSSSSTTPAASAPSSSPTPESTSAPQAPSSAPQPTPSAPSSNLDSFAQSVLDTTNKYRAQHGAAALTWSNELASYAKKYLDNQNCVFAHSGGPYGENLAMGYSSVSSAIDAWYNEVSSYDYSNPGFSMSTGHFTQLVWKGTTQVGCYSYDCGSSGQFVACEYSPAGNVLGNFAQNVS